ncbi:MAG TPA: right-handed parallel beta-helix repeat-containing protein [Thermoanaerobaculia bacterium]|jgi:hypothetical protein|nr:right-handed parallel beta-helix repeat-containing protein [Thermoanaerobaculia bacterium]
MWTRSVQSTITLAVALLTLAGTRANATTIRTFVSGSGSDSNPCTQSAPCATFAGALTNTSTGGEIYVLDAADYSTTGGTTTINKPVSIIGAGARGGITGEVLIATTGLVLLKGIDIDAAGNAGIFSTTSGANLVVDDCTIVDALWGIYFGPSGSAPSNLVVRNSVISNCLLFVGPPSAVAGIQVQGASTGIVDVTIDNVMLDNNWHGVYALDYTNVTIRNSTLTQSTHSGLRAESLTGGTVNVVLAHSESSHNLGNGVVAIGTGATIRISEVAITDNAVGINYTTGGAVISFGNNSVGGNLASLSPSSTVALQ